MLYLYVADAEDPEVKAVTVTEYEPRGVDGDEFTYNVVEQEDSVVHEFWENEHVIPEGAEQEKVTVVRKPQTLSKLTVTDEFVWVPRQTVELEGLTWTDEIEGSGMIYK